MTDYLPDIARLKRLDDDEWLAVQRAYSGRLYAYAHRRMSDRASSEDVLQETWLGAVRGIADFDTRYTFEQYLFGICKNRTIDALRRRRPRTLGTRGDEGEERNAIEDLAVDFETPSRVMRRAELSQRGRELLIEALRSWVEETWQQGEFERLTIVEALLGAGWRNREVWKRFGLRDETAVAGVKFRAIKRLRELVAVRESGSDLLHALERAAEGEEGALDMDVQQLWREGRVSCASRHWIARLLAGNLEAGPAGFLRFHLQETKCAWCLANEEDLARERGSGDLAPLVERVRASTVRYLRSRTQPG